MRVIPSISRLALAFVLAFVVCASPYTLSAKDGHIRAVTQEAHAAVPVALAGLAASAGVTPEVAAAAIGAIVASVSGVSLYALANSRGTSVVDEAEGYLLLGQATGRLPDFSEPSPPDPNKQDGNDPESRGNKLKAVVAALGVSAGASVAFSALDNLVDSVFDWATAKKADNGADSLSDTYLQLISDYDNSVVYKYGAVNTSLLSGSRNGDTYDSLSSIYLLEDWSPGYTSGGELYLFSPSSTFSILPDGRFHADIAVGTYTGSVFRNYYNMEQFKLFNRSFHANGGYFNGTLNSGAILHVIPSGVSLGSVIGDMSNVYTQLPEIIDDSVKKYGFATSSESQATIVNNYINEYVNQPAVGDRVTVITIPTVSPGEATYPDYKYETEPENVTPIKPNPDVPDTPSAPSDVKKRFEEICSLAFGSVFPFCLIEDLKQLWNKISLSAEPDFRVVIPTSEFNVDGADEVVIDASDLVILGGYVRGFLDLLFVSGLLVLSFRLFLNRGGE